MEGWLYGIFTLAGVLVGGAFTYLGLREQLKQQKEIQSIEWRRKVRSELLLKLRTELANMATKSERLATASDTYLELFGIGDVEEIKRRGQELRDSQNEWDLYISSGTLKQILFLQYDNSIVNGVEEILNKYTKSHIFFENYWTIQDLTDDEKSKKYEKELDECREVFEQNKAKIMEVQELINKKLEEL